MKKGVFIFVCLSIVLLHAKLTTTTMEHFFKGNKVEKSSSKGNLQYLIGESGASTYLALSDKNQEFVREIADTILDDELLKKEVKDDGGDMSYFLEDLINLLSDIQLVRSGINEPYKYLLEDIKNLKLEVNLKDNLKTKILGLKSEIDNIIKIHKLLDEKGSQNEMDFRKKEKAILYEIKRIKAKIKEKDDIIAGRKGILKEKDDEIKEKDDIIAGRKGILKEKDDIIAGRKGILKEKDDEIKEKDDEIKKLKEYLQTLERFKQVVGKHK